MNEACCPPVYTDPAFHAATPAQLPPVGEPAPDVVVDDGPEGAFPAQALTRHDRQASVE